MKMFYGERLGGDDEPHIAERGVFFSITEFAPYRELGWSSTAEINSETDAYLASQKECLSECRSPLACSGFGYCRERNFQQ